MAGIKFSLKEKRISRHAEAANEEEQRDKKVDLASQTRPDSVRQRRPADAQGVEHTNNQYECGVFEKPNKGIDDAGN